MSVPSFQAIVYLDPELGLCLVFQESAVLEVTEERFEAFKKACCGEPVRKVQSPVGLRIEGYRCADPAEQLTCIKSMWVLADLSHKHFGLETDVAAPRPL